MSAALDDAVYAAAAWSATAFSVRDVRRQLAEWSARGVPADAVALIRVYVREGLTPTLRRLLKRVRR
jgi:hypothetical protein